LFTIFIIRIAELGYPQSDDYMESKKEIDDYSDED
jgi:hypothetical protein